MPKFEGNWGWREDVYVYYLTLETPVCNGAPVKVEIEEKNQVMGIISI